MDSSRASSEVLAYDYALFDRANNSELYQLARAAGHVVLPNTPRDLLIRILIGAAPAPPLEEHVVDEWRKALMLFIIDHRKKLETQLTCPAKSFDPRACFGCVDVQVVSCLVNNASNLHLIQLHRRKT